MMTQTWLEDAGLECDGEAVEPKPIEPPMSLPLAKSPKAGLDFIRTAY